MSIHSSREIGFDLGSLIQESENDFSSSSRAYVDENVFDAEMAKIFSKTWLYIRHESQLPNEGDYLTTMIGKQPVIVSRGHEGSIHVLINRCRHRGATVCRSARGTSNFFRCPYHARTYANDGQLVGVAQAGGDKDEIARDELGLVAAPKVDTYRGLVFASLSGEVVRLDDHLGGIKTYIDAWFNRSPVGTLKVLPTNHKYHYPGNWKWQAENGHDGYHGNYVHESWQLVFQRASESTLNDVREFREAGTTRSFKYGHALIERPAGLNPVSSWAGRMMKKYSEYEIADLSARRNIYIFPNLYLFDTHLRTIRPIAFNKTEVQLDVSH